jgi:hypothetical protein
MHAVRFTAASTSLHTNSIPLQIACGRSSLTGSGSFDMYSDYPRNHRRGSTLAEAVVERPVQATSEIYELSDLPYLLLWLHRSGEQLDSDLALHRTRIVVETMIHEVFNRERISRTVAGIQPAGSATLHAGGKTDMARGGSSAILCRPGRTRIEKRARKEDPDLEVSDSLSARIPDVGRQFVNVAVAIASPA